MSIRNIVQISLLLVAAPMASGEEAVDTVVTGFYGNVGEHAIDNRRAMSLTWVNPAMKAYESGTSLNEVQGEFHWREDGSAGAIDPQQGTGETTWKFDASSYMKYKTSTLWGHASYENGTTRNVVWNETSDLSTVYPYVLADSVGGDMKLERYSFSGGWTDTYGRWDIGGTLGYSAGLYYRSVDPRPRNVTALLEASVGGGYHVNEEVLVSAMLGFEKYKQTNEVEFYSDLGSRRLIHLAGLASHYARFAGTGLETYYKGHTWHGGLNLTVGQRWWLSAVASRTSLEYVLSDLNNLPIVNITHNELNAEAAWFVRNDLAVVANACVARRVGTENIFGEPTSGVYDQIASHDRYFNNIFTATVQAQYTMPLGDVRLQVVPEVGYDHNNQYHNTLGNREYTNRLAGGAQVKALWSKGRHLFTVNAQARYSDCVDDGWDVTVTDDEMAPIATMEQHRHDLAAASQLYTRAGVSMTSRLPRGKVLLRASVQWQRTGYTDNYTQNEIAATVGVVF